ncbi:Stp1/IreP family PP2C-type Ser/Thr phosphatase [Tetragenococcus koreensis]|uniref:Stp1/IreP family PP2C-type Ser/Thr phosphatase n=1 Tax=Tetragenococcus koreensis TaxID=290335 RepID=UPI001F1CDCC8|nr:Stp1/IreP family PP2C-type Ser/Thr phosphatase [Tetragenococcus koreensis]MCF1617131.1 Stp1/IreP family PP2C-type Ser/Thr phosphatase [Tetragenococcus koreensis]MCF1622017.1 Stp1/IreP family PP2C-type Ser/Thr phosphatase [Tetragenococcus koreensis]MCF1678017.1 Stp1/IreP family PP2C-type Ser/Thr phosphatase [Tetragenococcus koreensis]MCF1680539.1 Stp1/IreP family PP2C-type Ser/Thr phosphatase [Tetragenococcus koreensis]MCF1682790.1 Stp1/IreP family PP2C-type Ser/Thr phosphatase [Tetragenococ
MKISFQSNVGKIRSANQDYVGVFKNKKDYTLAMLADGMGGHQAGDVASKTAVNEIGDQWEKTKISDSEKAAKWLIKTIQEENTAIYQKGQATPEFAGMGTTIEAAAVFEKDFTIAHVGDSRIYTLMGQRLMQLTEDHSLVNELVKTGEISKEMAANHPQKNIVTRSVGMPGSIEVDISTHLIDSKKCILLCSDGLTNMVSEDEIAQFILSSSTTDEAVEKMIDTANDHGGVDNITVLMIDFGGAADA